MEVVREEWLGLVFRDRPQPDPGAIREDVRWLYEMSGLNPPLVISLNSPMACQVAANMLRRIADDQVWPQVWDQVEDQVRAQVEAQVRDQVCTQVWDQVDDQVWAQVWPQVEVQVRDQVCTQVWPQVWDQVEAQVRDQVCTQVWDQVDDQVWAQVWDQVDDQVWAQVRDQVCTQVRRLDYYTPSWAHTLGDAGFGAWADYWSRIGIVRSETLTRYLTYLRRGVWYALFFRDVAIVCGPPVEVHRDAQYRLHREDGPAILWRDGYAQYMWHGVRVPQALIEKPDEITREDLIREQNAEVRRAYRERLGNERFAAMLDLEAVDRDAIGAPGYEQEYILWRTRELDPVAGEHIQFVQVRCHSTGREYMLCVPPDIRDVYRALAWTFGKAPHQYRPLVEA